MRRWRRGAGRLLVGAVLALGTMGMGSLGGGRDAGAPMRDYRVTFVDVDGTQVSADHVSVGGDTMLEGDMGRGRLRIPFDSITRIELSPGEGERDRLRAEVTLREGSPVTLSLRSATTFYGQIPSGAYQIRARDLRSVAFTR